jgi:hypothetical protein
VNDRVIAEALTARAEADDTGLFRVVADGYYTLAFPLRGVEFRVDRLRRERHELFCELSVSCGLIGARAIDGVLSVGTFNLSSPNAAQQRAKILATQARTQGLDWSSMLEELRQRVLIAERTGDPSISLRTVPKITESAEEFAVLGLAVPRRHPACWFGDGGVGKSMLALWVGAELARTGERVGYFDWELDAFTHRLRLERLCGPDMPEIRYVTCDRPLIHELDRLRRIVRDDGLTFAILDSVGYGTAGAPESAEAAMDYCRGVRQLGIGTLWLAHVTKGEQGDQRPFGSTFWHNSARATWNLKLASTSPDGATHQIAGFHRKANLGRLRSPVGIQAAYRGESLTFSNVDIASIDEVSASLPMHLRLRGALLDGAKTITDLATTLNAKPDTIKKTLSRNSGKLFICATNTPDGIHRWGLLDRRTL